MIAYPVAAVSVVVDGNDDVVDAVLDAVVVRLLSGPNQLINHF